MCWTLSTCETSLVWPHIHCSDDGYAFWAWFWDFHITPLIILIVFLWSAWKLNVRWLKLNNITLSECNIHSVPSVASLICLTWTLYFTANRTLKYLSRCEAHKAKEGCIHTIRATSPSLDAHSRHLPIHFQRARIQSQQSSRQTLIENQEFPKRV